MDQEHSYAQRGNSFSLTEGNKGHFLKFNDQICLIHLDRKNGTAIMASSRARLTFYPVSSFYAMLS